jgi:hypothetical protein
MISAEKQYDFITSQIAARLKEARDAFKLFIQIFSAIVGGSVWLATTEKIQSEAKSQYATLSSLLVVVLTLAMTVMIVDALRGWYANRKAQVQLGGLDPAGRPNIPPPRIPPSGISEMAMTMTMIAAASGFCLFNPFTRL